MQIQSPSAVFLGAYQICKTMAIREAESDDDIALCLPVLSELRVHFKQDSSKFVERIQQQRRHGYHLVYLEDQGAVQAVAGYRIRDNVETPEPK